MTMQSKVSKAVFNGNGATTDFPFDFKVWDTSEISVTITGPDGASIPATGWTATLTDPGGTVTYRKDGAPLPSGWKLAILRDMPFTQPVDLLSGTRFDPQVFEDSMDMACAERQQLLEQLQRAVIIPPTSDETPIKMAEQLLQAEKTAQASAAAAQASESAAAASEQAAATSAESADQSRAEAAASAAAASQNATAASQSAEAAAKSEGKAADSAASILGLQVEVATLDPGLPASGDYDPETGILHLGIPKGDSGAAAIATPTSLGSVMPQTGHDDGLELGADGTLRAIPVPIGGILAFSGTFGGEGNRFPIPLGGDAPDMHWCLCDGTITNGLAVPDLRGRMIMGASDEHPAGSSGGSANHSHSLSGTVGATTLTVEQLANHSHRMAENKGVSGTNAYVATAGGLSHTQATGGSKPHTHTLSGASGSASSLPRYYALALIMRIA